MCLASGIRHTLGRRADQLGVPRGHRLHVAAVGRPDQQRRAGGDPRHHVHQRRRRSLVGEHRKRDVLDEQPRSVDPEGGGVELLVLLSRLPRPGTLGDHRGDVGVLGRRLQHLFGADREADAADPGRVDVGPGLEEVDGGMDVRRPAPAEHVAVTVAVTHASTVQQQHAVAVPREHPRVRLRHVPAVEGDDRGAVLRRHVPARELEAVARGDGDVLVRRAQVRCRDLCHGDVCGEVREADREGDEVRHHHCTHDAQRPPAVPAEPVPAAATGPPELVAAQPEQHQPRRGREEAGVVVAGRPDRLGVVARLDGAHDDPEQPDGQRDHAGCTGPHPRVEPGGKAQQSQWHQTAHEVVGRRRTARRLDEVVVGHVQGHGRCGSQEDAVRQRGRGHRPTVGTPRADRQVAARRPGDPRPRCPHLRGWGQPHGAGGPAPCCRGT